MPPYQYPLNMAFRIAAFTPQISLKDANGREEFFVHQKLSWKENVSVYSDSSKNRELYKIQADRAMGISMRYNFTDSTSGQPFGAVRRDGMRSIFSAAYSVFDGMGEQPTHHLKEDNAMLRAAHMVVRDIEVIGMFAGYFFNPSFTLYQSGSETPVMHLVKKPAMMFHQYEITKLSEPANETEETRLLLALVQMTLQEHTRGS